jgi:hypothetical protein
LTESRAVESLESRRLLASGYQIDLVFESSVNSTIRLMFEQAATRWEQVITGDVPDVGSGGWGGPVDDVRITARVVSIDGPGNAVAQARPTFIRSGSKLPIAGEIELDSADITSLTNDGRLDDTILHEMAHVLGYGTLWASFGNLTTGLGGSNPQYVGTNARREYRNLSGNQSATGVPLENTGGTGTRDAHWRESTFDNELMTGYVDTGANPLSRITIGALADLGYQVDYNRADTYFLPGSSTGTITGTVFNDLDRDGIIDSGESGVPNTVVYLDTDNDGQLDPGERTTLSNSNGVYTFNNLAPSTYRVRQVLNTSYIQTTPANNAAHVVAISSGQVRGGLNFGIFRQTTNTASIRGTVWRDNDRDGTFDSGESGVSGRVVYIDSNNNGSLDTNEPQTLTDGSGVYQLPGLAAGTYKVRQILQSGWVQTFPANNYGNNVTLSTGQSATNVNFGTVQNSTSGGGSISGRVWNDADRDRVIDSNEFGLSGRTVYLDLNNNGVKDGSEPSTTTNSTGNYTFSNLAAGTYKIRQILFSGWIQTTPTNNYGNNATISSNGSASGLNFGTAQGSARSTVVAGREQLLFSGKRIERRYNNLESDSRRLLV